MTTRTRAVPKPDEKTLVGYLRLVRAHPLRLIRSDDELDRAVKILNELIDRDDLDDGERDYQQALAVLIGHYEADHEPTPKVAPADMLRHLLDSRGVTQARLAADTGVSEATVSEILAGKRPVSTKNRRLFSEYFGVDPVVFV